MRKKFQTTLILVFEVFVQLLKTHFLTFSSETKIMKIAHSAVVEVCYLDKPPSYITFCTSVVKFYCLISNIDNTNTLLLLFRKSRETQLTRLTAVLTAGNHLNLFDFLGVKNL